MKRIVAGIGVVLLFCGLAGTAWSSAVTFEARAGFFHPNSQDVRDVYKNGLAFGADITFALWKGLGLWAGVDYYSKKGKLTYTLEDTTLRVVPLFAGLKLQATSSAVRPYAALAAGYFLYKETNILGTVSGSKLGLLAQAGILIRIKGPLSLDIHGRYTSCRAKTGEPDPVMTDLGGFQGGLGLAVRF
jgi:hypothetical protein